MVHSLSQEPSYEVNKPKHKDEHLGAGSPPRRMFQRTPLRPCLPLARCGGSRLGSKSLQNLHCKSILLIQLVRGGVVEANKTRAL